MLSIALAQYCHPTIYHKLWNVDVGHTTLNKVKCNMSLEYCYFNRSVKFTYKKQIHYYLINTKVYLERNGELHAQKCFPQHIDEPSNQLSVSWPETWSVHQLLELNLNQPVHNILTTIQNSRNHKLPLSQKDSLTFLFSMSQKDRPISFSKQNHCMKSQ